MPWLIYLDMNLYLRIVSIYFLSKITDKILHRRDVSD